MGRITYYMIAGYLYISGQSVECVALFTCRLKLHEEQAYMRRVFLGKFLSVILAYFSELASRSGGYH